MLAHILALREMGTLQHASLSSEHEDLVITGRILGKLLAPGPPAPSTLSPLGAQDSDPPTGFSEVLRAGFPILQPSPTPLMHPVVRGGDL